MLEVKSPTEVFGKNPNNKPKLEPTSWFKNESIVIIAVVVIMVFATIALLGGFFDGDNTTIDKEAQRLQERGDSSLRAKNYGLAEELYKQVYKIDKKKDKFERNMEKIKNDKEKDGEKPEPALGGFKPHLPNGEKISPEMRQLLNVVAEKARNASSWETLFDEAGEHVHSKHEHDYGHPESYTYLVAAAKRAISDRDNWEMYHRMMEAVEDNTKIAKLSISVSEGHHYWEEVRESLASRDTNKLNHVIDEVYDHWMHKARGIENDVDKHHHH